MCGIVAVWGQEERSLASEMLQRISHRGPDYRGVEGVAHGVLAHARLSILDLSGGNQPMTNDRGDLSVTFNGEIYNHLELRRDLEPRHAFASRSDTEVLLHLYEERGEDMLPLLDGMFAFVLAGPRGLLMARDPLGIKPLYYGRCGDLVLAASELKAFPPMDELHALPAGHFLVLGEPRSIPRDGLPAPVAYSFPTVVAPRITERPVADVLFEIRSRLERAVVKRLMSDVPVGVFLSGGLDSSLVAAFMRPHTVELHSFTAGMEGSADLEAAREVADLLETEHHELVYTEDDVVAALPEVIRHLESFDAPLVRSALPNYFLARLAAEHVKVVLTGEGADELFAGYEYLGRKGGGAELRDELRRITERLQDTNLQRGDRMTMAWGLEGRVPFLDLGLVRFAARLPIELLEPLPGRPEKSLLREACRGLLPPQILHRRKMKFSEGAGSSEVVATLAARTITPEEYASEREPAPGLRLRSPEELLYYRIWREAFGSSVPLDLVGRTRDPGAAAEAS
jgi:asparagine synthase (glutamine-hydrolysing)